MGSAGEPESQTMSDWLSAWRSLLSAGLRMRRPRRRQRAATPCCSGPRRIKLACVLPLHAHVRPDDLGYDTALGVQYCDITGAMAQVEAARLRADERFGVITFASADAARAAAAALNGTQLCGEALAVTATDPQAGARTSKRPRVAA